jgi:hypothetical protein
MARTVLSVAGGGKRTQSIVLPRSRVAEVNTEHSMLIEMIDASAIAAAATATSALAVLAEANYARPPDVRRGPGRRCKSNRKVS